MLEKSNQILSSQDSCKPKSLDVALDIAGIQRTFSENLRLRCVSDGGNLCPLWLVILKSVRHSIENTL